MVAYGSERSAFYANTENFVVGTAIRNESSSAIEISDIETINLGSILDQYEFDRCTLICDIEGGESDLLRYESDVLKDRVATIILEVHEWALGKVRVNEMFAELADLGFRSVSAELDTYTFQKQP